MREQLGIHGKVQQVEVHRAREQGAQQRRLAGAPRPEQEEALRRRRPQRSGEHTAILYHTMAASMPD
jgi:hypothetical protein